VCVAWKTGADQIEKMLVRTVLEFVNRHALQHLMTARIAANRLLAEHARKRIQGEA
jgi:hypothetical protein